MFRTIKAKFAGSCCRRCGGAIQVGENMRYGGRGLTYHLAKNCPAATPRPAGRSYDDIAREGGYEDTMGVSPEVLEHRYG